MNVVELDVEGMTCAACAARIEKNLTGEGMTGKTGSNLPAGPPSV